MIVRRAQPWLGTLVELAAEGADAAALGVACGRAFARVAAVHTALSFQDPASELTRINRAAQHDWVALAPDLAAVFAAALDFARASDGLFDPSVAGWLVESGHLPRHPGFPTTAAPDWRAIELDGDRVRYLRPLLVDLSGIAKGYAVDAALAVLRDAGASAATVNAGGDLARYGARAVPIRVRLPRHVTYSLPLAELTRGAVATSAQYFQPGTLLHPRNRALLCADASITVFAPDCTAADALTKVVAADAQAATTLLGRHAAQAVVMDARGASVGDAGGWRALSLEVYG